MEGIENLKYPIGKYSPPESINPQILNNWILQIAQLPKDLRTLTVNLSEDDLDKTYRPGGWNVRQLVHHIGDSHLHIYVRFKWTLTEDKPTIKAYFEDRWADLDDSTAPIDMSVDFIEALHRKWVFLMESLTDQQWERKFVHPESEKQITLSWNLGLYAWHGQHHLAHIKTALQN